MWVARDRFGLLALYHEKPVRVTENRCIPSRWGPINNKDYEFNDVNCWINNNMFPHLTWKDEPLEVELIAMSQFERFIDDVIHMYISSCEDDRFSNDAERIRYIQDEMTGKLDSHVDSKK